MAIVPTNGLPVSLCYISSTVLFCSSSAIFVFLQYETPMILETSQTIMKINLTKTFIIAPIMGVRLRVARMNVCMRQQMPY
jgi:hypothetical protein